MTSELGREGRNWKPPCSVELSADSQSEKGSRNGNRLKHFIYFIFLGCPPRGQNHFFLLKKKISGSGLRKKENHSEPLEIPLVSGGSLRSESLPLLRRCRSRHSNLPVFLLEPTPPGCFALRTRRQRGKNDDAGGADSNRNTRWSI